MEDLCWVGASPTRLDNSLSRVGKKILVFKLMALFALLGMPNKRDCAVSVNTHEQGTREQTTRTHK